MATDDFFRARLDQMIDLRHPLAVLAHRMPWTQIDAALAPAFARQDRPGQVLAGSDLFGPTLEIAGAGTSAAGRRTWCGKALFGRVQVFLKWTKLCILHGNGPAKCVLQIDDIGDDDAFAFLGFQFLGEQG